MDPIDYDSGMDEIAELRRDAERYRWLRAKPERALTVYMEWEGWQHEYRTPERFDADVDKAMAVNPSPR